LFDGFQWREAVLFEASDEFVEDLQRPAHLEVWTYPGSVDS
jgi:hypothetical protein